MTKFVVGCCVWELDWCLELWFQSVRANLEPSETGLIFVVPPTEGPAREIIDANKDGFDFVEVMRDKAASHRVDGVLDQHAGIAATRNQILKPTWESTPDFFFSWDPDLLLRAGTVAEILEADVGACTVWTWLNRHKPIVTEHHGVRVEFQRPVQASALQWPRRTTRGNPHYTAVHYPSHEFAHRASGFWTADVGTDFLCLGRDTWPNLHFSAHRDSEFVPIGWQLAQRERDLWVYGKPGVHLPHYNAQEINMGFPHIMALADVMPLQASRAKPEDPDLAMLGLYPVEDAGASNSK